MRELQAQILEQNSLNEARISELQSTHNQILSEKESQINDLEQKVRELNDEISKFVKVISDLIGVSDVEQEKRPNVKSIILPIAAKLGNSEVVNQLITIKKIDINSKYILDLFFEMEFYISFISRSFVLFCINQHYILQQKTIMLIWFEYYHKIQILI